MKQTIEVSKGLDGVVVGETRISLVDGERGELSYRGIALDALVERRFAEVAALVATGALDETFGARLCEHAALSPREEALVLALPDNLHPMHALIGATPLLDRPPAFDELGDAAQGLVVAAKLPAVLATHLRRAPLSPGLPGTDPIERFLAAIDAPRSPEAHRAFEVAQILQLEHGFNAGAFAARVVASTLAPVENAIAAGLAALHGVLHGGADQAALETADRVASPDRAAAFVDERLATKTKVMGMGHREYRVVDPRARHLKRLAEALTAGTEHERTFRTLAAIEARFTERMAERDRALHANVEFYKGLVFRVLGLPPRAFTAVFATARVFGYVAHFVESREKSRIVRPQARYVGPPVRGEI